MNDRNTDWKERKWNEEWKEGRDNRKFWEGEGGKGKEEGRNIEPQVLLWPYFVFCSFLGFC